MSSAAVEKDVSQKNWGGGVSPFGVRWGKVFMWFFLVSDALTFTGLLVAFGFLRHKFADVWPVSEEVFVHFPFMGDQHVPLAYVALMTFILIMSSVTMVMAVDGGHRNDKSKVLWWLGLTIIGGFIFLGSQVWEWAHFIHGSEQGVIKDAYENGQWVEKAVHGANLKVNEYGHSLYGSFFFFITGFHGTHVASGVIINIIIFIRAWKGVYQKRKDYEIIEKTGLYWHFVDLVWVFVFTFFYLI